MLGIFILVGMALTSFGFYLLFEKGAHFVSTPNRLISYKKGSITLYDWEQFSGNMEINDADGDIFFELRTGTISSSKNSPSRYVPDKIHICGITNVVDIAAICKNRIKENDSTPSKKSRNR